MSDFKIEKILGKGSFGNVYLVTRKKDKKIYAIKTVILEKLNKKEQENSVNEVRILASVNHPNVIGYKEAFWNDKESSLNIVMEYADDGDLHTKIQKMRKEGGIFKESLIWSYSIQMIEGLKALHDKKIMHRDLKSANIFLVKENHQCKLGDMNVSKVIKDKVLITQTGTPYYASPEVWNDKPYSYKSDLWSIGCVIYELCELHPPFNGKDLDELYINVCKGKVERINKIYSDDLWKMILMLLQVDVKKRVDCDSFLNSKLIIRKKKEINELQSYYKNIDDNYNNGILLNTIKFSNINEIKAQLPRNKNYNDDSLNNKEFNINNQLFHTNNIESINPKKVNLYTNLIKNNNIAYNIPNINNIHYKNSIPNNIKNNLNEKSGKNNIKLNTVKNQSSDKIKNIKKKIKNNNIKSKHNKSLKKNYAEIINYHTENDEQKNEKRKSMEKEKLLKEIEYSKLLEQLKIQQEIQKIKEKENEIKQRNYMRSILNTPSTLDYDLSMKLNNKNRIKTEEKKENYIKIQNTIRYNPTNLIPNSIKKTKTNRLEINKLKNNKSIDNYLNKVKNNSYLKTNESKSTKKNKKDIPIYKNINREARIKTPLLNDKNNPRFQSEIYDNYNYYYYKNYNRLKRKEYSENPKSLGYLQMNQKSNMTEINDTNNNIDNNNYHLKSNKSSKSNANIIIGLNQNIIDNLGMKSKIINKKNNQYKKVSSVSKIRPSSATSKRIKDFNNNKSNILNYNYIQTNIGTQNNQNISYNFLDNNNNINNKSKIKTIGNNSSININYKNLIPNYKYIKNKSAYTSNSHNYNNNEKLKTTVDNNDFIENNNNLNRIKKGERSYDKNIKKINNKIRHYTFKRTYDEKRMKERKKNDIISNRDLTEPELSLILNPIKIKENRKNIINKKALNISLNDNIIQNNYLKQLNHQKNQGNKNPNLNQYYPNNINNNININDGNIKNNNNGLQIFNNYYSINNEGNCKIPVKVINVFN